MGRVLKKCSEIIDLIFMPVAMGLLVMLAVSCIIQVVSRYVFNASLGWTEEVARYCFIWVNMLGASILVKRKGHATIDFLVANLKGVKKQIHRTLICGLTLFVAGVLIYQSFLLMPVVMHQSSPATGISMLYVYLAVPVGAGGIFVHTLSELYDTIFPGKVLDGQAGV